MKYGLGIIAGLILVSGLALDYHERQVELENFLHQRPYGWIESSLGWATPDRPRKGLSRVESFELNYPAGYYEVHIIPQRYELCIYGSTMDCSPVDGDGGWYRGEVAP